MEVYIYTYTLDPLASSVFTVCLQTGSHTPTEVGNTCFPNNLPNVLFGILWEYRQHTSPAWVQRVACPVTQPVIRYNLQSTDWVKPHICKVQTKKNTNPWTNMKHDRKCVFWEPSSSSHPVFDIVYFRDVLVTCRTRATASSLLSRREDRFIGCCLGE